MTAGRRLVTTVTVAVVALATVAAGFPVSSEAEPTLHTIATHRDLDLGVALRRGAWPGDPAYMEKLAANFTMVVPENEFKWRELRPAEHTWNFAPADAMVDWAEENGRELRGGPLIWHEGTPAWVEQRDWRRDDLIALMREHIHTVVGRYRGRIAQWDVVNEAFEPNGSFAHRRSVWARVIGPEFIDLAFRFAREADPRAELYLADYAAERLNDKANGIYGFVEGMVARGVPIDGYGMQMHTPLPTPPPGEIATNMARYAELGLRVAYTEMDVRIEHANPAVPPSDYWLQFQRKAYRELVDVCVAAPNCDTIVMWGLTDLHSWVPSNHPGYGWAHLWDKQYRAKPAYFGVRDSLLFTPTRGRR